MSSNGTHEMTLQSLSSLRESDPASIQLLKERLQRALEAVDELQDAARVTPDDLRLQVSM
jgi:hypothetical protein